MFTISPFNRVVSTVFRSVPTLPLALPVLVLKVSIDYDAPLTDIETNNNVVVPDSHIQLTDYWKRIAWLIHNEVRFCKDHANTLNWEVTTQQNDWDKFQQICLRHIVTVTELGSCWGSPIIELSKTTVYIYIDCHLRKKSPWLWNGDISTSIN